jgi:hypothetical protein
MVFRFVATVVVGIVMFMLSIPGLLAMARRRERAPRGG